MAETRLLFIVVSPSLYYLHDFSNYSTKSKYCDDSNKLVIGKMKDETEELQLNNLLGRSQKGIHSWEMTTVNITKQKA